jgi:hypothetical protein
MTEDEAYEKLDQELATGQRLATELVAHLYRMGGESATIPIEFEGRKYVVCIEQSST